jgi:hypothetical protein
MLKFLLTKPLLHTDSSPDSMMDWSLFHQRVRVNNANAEHDEEPEICNEYPEIEDQ